MTVPSRTPFLPIVLMVTLLIAPGTVGAPSAPSAVHGSGTAATFQAISVGVAIEGGAFDWTRVCADCLIRISFTQASVIVVQNGGVRTLGPGAYEIREFAGLFGHSQTDDGRFFVVLEGSGRVFDLG